MTSSGRLVRNSTVRAVYFALSIAVAFFMMPILVGHLGDRMYGVWTLVGTLLGYYGLIDIGLSSAVVRFISRAVGRSEKEEVRRVFCTAFYVFAALGAVAALITGVIALSLGFFIDVPDDRLVFRTLILIMGINFAFDFPVRAYASVFTAHVRDDLGVGISMAKLAISVPLVLWALLAGYGVVALAVIAVGTSIVDSGVRVFLAYRLEPAISLHPKWIDWSKLRPLMNYSAYTFVGRIADIFRFRLDHFVITAFVGLTAVTHYFVAGRLVEYLKEGFSQVVRVVTPVFSQDEGRNDFESIRRRFLFLTRLCLYLSVFLVGMGILYGRAFIEAWMGPGYADAYPVLVVLLGGSLLRLAQAPATPLLYGISKHKYHTYTALGEGLVNLALSLWLARAHGMLGVAIGTAVPMTLSALFVQPWYICRVTDLRLGRYASLMGAHLAVAASLVLVGWWIVGRYANAHFGTLIACGLAQTVLFVPLAILCGFRPEERVSFLRAIRQAASFSKKKEIPTPSYATVRD